MKELGALLEAARAAGALEAEVFSKTGRGRMVVLEPGLRPEAPLRTVSTSEEEGLALRVIDREGRRGFAWIGLAGPGTAGSSLVEAALASARQDRAAGGSAPAPLGPGPRPAAELPAPGLADPECMALPAERIAALLLEAAREPSDGSGSVAIDRLALSEAVTTISLVNSRGFSGSYTKSLAFLSIALVPQEPGAAAVVEERSACRLVDLDPRDCFREAWLGAGPARRPVAAPDSGSVPLLLTPRAAATFLAAIAPWVARGGLGSGKGGGLLIADDPTAPGRAGSVPFDGAGYETRRTVLVESGAQVARLSADGGHLVRPSYRDQPLVGPAALQILPAGDPASASHETAAGPGRSPILRAPVIEVVPGPVWSLRIRRGDWWRDGRAIGPADRLVWEGSLADLLRSVCAAGSDVRFYHSGAPFAAPSLRLDGLAPLRVEAPQRNAASV